MCSAHHFEFAPSRPVITYWPRKVHGVVRITDDSRILILDGLTPFGVSVECRVSLGSGELRAGQLGPSEWCTLRWTIKCMISDLLLAASWAGPRRLHLLATN